MAHLTNVISLTRKILEYVGIAVVGLILLVIVFRVGVFIKELVSPTPPKPPTVAFGKLPPSTFPESFDVKNYTYTINTLSGSLPDLPDRVVVYKLQEPQPSLLNLDKAKSVATVARFLDAPIALSDISYKWSKPDPFLTTITIDIQTLDFIMTSSYRSDKTVLDAAHIPDEGLAQTVSREFFDSIMQLPTYIDTSKTKATLLTITPGGLTSASSLSTAQIIRVDYFPKAIDTVPTYSPNPDESLIYSLVASGETDYPQIVEAQYYHKKPSDDKATYPIKTAQEAFEELKKGNAYIAANPTSSNSIIITNVSLGYYVDTLPQKYLWPIIVFQGDKGFYAYVSAVKDEWIQK